MRVAGDRVSPAKVAGELGCGEKVAEDLRSLARRVVLAADGVVLLCDQLPGSMEDARQEMSSAVFAMDRVATALVRLAARAAQQDGGGEC